MPPPFLFGFFQLPQCLLGPPHPPVFINFYDGQANFAQTKTIVDIGVNDPRSTATRDYDGFTIHQHEIIKKLRETVTFNQKSLTFGIQKKQLLDASLY